MAMIRLYEGPELDDNLVADIEVAVVPRVGETIRTTVLIPSSERPLGRYRYVVRDVVHGVFGGGAEGMITWEPPTIWVLVEDVSAVAS